MLCIPDVQWQRLPPNAAETTCAKCKCLHMYIKQMHLCTYMHIHVYARVLIHMNAYACTYIHVTILLGCLASSHLVRYICSWGHCAYECVCMQVC